MLALIPTLVLMFIVSMYEPSELYIKTMFMAKVADRDVRMAHLGFHGINFSYSDEFGKHHWFYRDGVKCTLFTEQFKQWKKENGK